MSAPRYLVAATALALWASAACSESTSDEPSGQSGAGEAGMAGSSQQGGEAGAEAGSGGEPGSGGDAGSGAGGAPGGSAGAGGENEGGAAGGAPAGPYQAELGQLCPVQDVIGVVQLAGFPAPYVQATLYDRKSPWLGEPELSTETCAFHHYTPGQCNACDVDHVCSLAGECLPERRTVKDAALIVRTGADQRQYEADEQLGGIYSQLDIGDADSAYAMTLSWGQHEVRLAPMPVASGKLTNVAVTIEGDYALPGALDATWEASGQGAFVRSTIPINHHAGGPTFTECAAPESAGAFHADAAMIDPLAVHTGLEFQGIEHVFVAAATTPDGCVEFRFGEQLFVFPE